jgi:hypothetical protein
MPQNKNNAITPWSALSGSRLARMIHKAEIPETVLRSLPAQTLYLVVKQNGLQSSSEIIEMASLQQCRLLLDFDIWDKDSLREEGFWEWLALTDEEQSLRPLQKFLKYVDFKIVAFFIDKYVDIVTYDDQTENPPAPGYYTPDKGHTWIQIRLEDSTNHYSMGRLLAMLFETDADLFYQILSVPGVSTRSGLEEDAYQEKIKRLSAEGIPDDEYAFELNSPLDEKSAASILEKGGVNANVIDIMPIEPLIYHNGPLEPLASLALKIESRDDFNSELTLLMNAAIIRWKVQFHEKEALEGIVNKVKGTLNIGIEIAQSLSHRDLKEIYTSLGLKGLYRLGLGKLMQVQKEVKKSLATVAEQDLSSEQMLIKDGFLCPFPQRPAFLKPEVQTDEKLAPDFEPFEHLHEIDSALNGLSQHLR